ncbi:MAG: class I SAM-dependent methyltransferase [Synergistaceae bacterium]|nr:class I SAM-dependent methyltransferase [Synergistaceae bacterium]
MSNIMDSGLRTQDELCADINPEAPQSEDHAMSRGEFEEMLETQSAHWWFEGRRRVIDRIIRKKIFFSQTPHILEIGSGTGANLGILSRYGHVTAMELDDYARSAIQESSLIAKVKGWLPNGLDEINGKTFSLICMFDVLEHIEDDGAALEALKPYVARGGFLFVTVPAYQWMFSAHDKRMGHYRRYTRTHLKRLISSHGFTVTYSGYMNTFLFPLMALGRAFNKSGTGIPGFGLNKILTAIYSFESLFVPSISLPFGGSVVAVCRL